MSQLAKRYAQAAWDVAHKSGSSAALVADFGAFCAALEQDPKLSQALQNPAFKDERVGVLEKVLASQATNPVAHHLLHLLLEHERIPLLGDVQLALRDLADGAEGRTRAQVKVAVPLSEAQHQRIEAVLTQRMGKPVVAQVQVDPDMVAGMVCRVGKLTFDSSLKKQLGQFAERAGASHADL